MAQRKTAAKPRKSPSKTRKSAAGGKPAPSVVEFDGESYKRFGRSFGNIWAPTEEGEVLEGTVTSKHEVKNKLARKGQKPTQTVLEILDSDAATWSIFESSAVRDFMDAAEVGSEVRIVYQGQKNFKGDDGKPRKYKMFDCYIKDE